MYKHSHHDSTEMMNLIGIYAVECSMRAPEILTSLHSAAGGVQFTTSSLTGLDEVITSPCEMC